ncbi:MAG: SRPBCC family protein, partial [Elusimicrobia bacterium]|nr:SRPBCC family protein [Elusimicrobiota bacterium]
MAAIALKRTLLIDAAPAALWPSLSDTDRLNRAVGLPVVTYEPPPPDGVVRRARATQFGVLPLSWDEHPLDWVEDGHYFVERVFHGGPLAWAKGGMRLAPEGSGTRVEIVAEAEPRGSLSGVAARIALQASIDGMARLVE